jgi:hypothetical protein
MAETWGHYEVRVTSDIKEAEKRISQGFEYVCSFDKSLLLRKHDDAEQKARIALLEHCTSRCRDTKSIS